MKFPNCVPELIAGAVNSIPVILQSEPVFHSATGMEPPSLEWIYSEPSSKAKTPVVLIVPELSSIP